MSSLTKFMNYQRLVSDYFGAANNHKGEVGIEIEVEGRNLPNRIASYWSVHADGSLRNGGVEYVLTSPIERKNVLRYLQYLQKKLAEEGAEVVQSPRTSVHVHLNAKDQTILEVYNNLVLYMIFEEALTNYAGPTRVGNLFCLRAKDSQYWVDRLSKAAETDDYSRLWDEGHIRYAAVNVCALQKFNSLEYRALRGTVDADEIYEWVKILLIIKDKAKEYQTPPDIVKDFSVLGPEKFCDKILGEYGRCVTSTIGWQQMLWEGMRLAQDVAYARSWEYKTSRPIARTFGDSGVAGRGGGRLARPGFAGRPRFIIDDLQVEVPNVEADDEERRRQENLQARIDAVRVVERPVNPAPGGIRPVADWAAEFDLDLNPRRR